MCAFVVFRFLMGMFELRRVVMLLKCFAFGDRLVLFSYGFLSGVISFFSVLYPPPGTIQLGAHVYILFFDVETSTY